MPQQTNKLFSASAPSPPATIKLDGAVKQYSSYFPFYWGVKKPAVLAAGGIPPVTTKPNKHL
jgi:hypothetical protein